MVPGLSRCHPAVPHATATSVAVAVSAREDEGRLLPHQLEAPGMSLCSPVSPAGPVAPGQPHPPPPEGQV